MAQFVMTQTNPDLRNPIDMMFHIQLWMFLIVAPLSFIFEGNGGIVVILKLFYLVSEICGLILRRKNKS